MSRKYEKLLFQGNPCAFLSSLNDLKHLKELQFSKRGKERGRSRIFTKFLQLCGPLSLFYHIVLVLQKAFPAAAGSCFQCQHQTTDKRRWWLAGEGSGASSSRRARYLPRVLEKTKLKLKESEYRFPLFRNMIPDECCVITTVWGDMS